MGIKSDKINFVKFDDILLQKSVEIEQNVQPVSQLPRRQNLHVFV